MNRKNRLIYVLILALVLFAGLTITAKASAAKQGILEPPFGKLNSTPDASWCWPYGGCGSYCAPYKTCLRAEFVRDVTIPDGSYIGAGKPFTKTWRIRNAGTCAWTTDYSLVYVSGTALGSVQAVRLPHAVAPGKTVDISVNMVAPNSFGSFQSDWLLRTAGGEFFGVGCSGQTPVWASITTTAYNYQPCAPCYSPSVPCAPGCQPQYNVPQYNVPQYNIPQYGYQPAPVPPATYPQYYGKQPSVTTPNNAARNPYCNNKVRSINDISIKDGAKLAPNEIFRKTWSLKNGGTCIWDQGYTLIFSGGDAMGGKRVVNIPRTVYPGERVEISIDLQAPSIPGHYRGYYMIQDSLGYTFGYGSYANTAFWVDIYVDGSLTPKSDAAFEMKADESEPAQIANVPDGGTGIRGETTAESGIEAPLLMDGKASENEIVVLDSKQLEGNACGGQRSEINFIAPDIYEVSWFLTNEGTNTWDPETYAVVNVENSESIETVVSDIAVQPTKPGEETRISFTVKAKDPASSDPLWTKFHLEHRGLPFCEVYFPLN